METALEKTLFSVHKPQMVEFVAAHPECFEELITLVLKDKQPYTWRATWLLWSCMVTNDVRVRKYIKQLIEILPNRKENQQRELLKILHLMKIDEEYEGQLLNYCIDIWLKLNIQPSVRFNAFRMMVIIAKKHPELFQEIKSLTEKRYTDTLSSGVKKSLEKILKTNAFRHGMMSAPKGRFPHT